MLIKTLTRLGSSHALIFDKSILQLFNIEPNTPLRISSDNGKRLIIEPAPKKQETPATK